MTCWLAPPASILLHRWPHLSSNDRSEESVIRLKDPASVETFPRKNHPHVSLFSSNGTVIRTGPPFRAEVRLAVSVIQTRPARCYSASGGVRRVVRHLWEREEGPLSAAITYGLPWGYRKIWMESRQLLVARHRQFREGCYERRWTLRWKSRWKGDRTDNRRNQEHRAVLWRHFSWGAIVGNTKQACQ